MKLIEIERQTDSNGQLILPADLLDAIGISPGDTVRLAYLAFPSDSNTYKRFVLAPAKTDEGMDLTVPHDMLKAANIPDGSDLEVSCANGAVIITAGDILDSLPDDLWNLFSDLGFDPDTVRKVMRDENFGVTRRKISLKPPRGIVPFLRRRHPKGS